MPHTERDIDTLARTIWGEARNQGRAGILADRAKLKYWKGRACNLAPSLAGCVNGS